MKIISKKGNGYLISTVFTNIQLLDVCSATVDIPLELLSAQEQDQDAQFKPLIKHLSDVNSCIKIKLDAFNSLLSLETIYKVSISTICQACQSNVAMGRSCAFVGCHIPISERTIKFVCNAIFQMEDETYGAIVHVKDLNVCRSIFYMISEEEWNLILKTAEHRGEIVYLNKKEQKLQDNLVHNADTFSAVEISFTMLCEVYPMTYYTQYVCKLRPFSTDKKSDSKHWNDDQLNFICLDASSTH